MSMEILKNSHACHHWLELLIKNNYKVEVDLACYTMNKNITESFDSKNPESLFSQIILLINSWSEYHSPHNDAYGRFPYEASLQHKHGIYEQNLVHNMIKSLLKHHGVDLADQPSKVIISHDIDTLHSGFIYEFYRGMTTMDFPLMFRVLFSLATKKSLWWNLDSIVEMLDRYDFKSIFYFIVENGWSEDRIKNADYNIDDNRLQTFIQSSLNYGFEIGLHKSSLDNHTLDQEKRKLGEYCTSNRHHFLRFTVPKLYRDLSISDFKTDSSLCFPYKMGFRNSYGLPFQPLDLETGETYDILEIPFQIMDGMFKNRTRRDSEKAAKEIISFLDSNRHNAILGMLWHNTDLNKVGKKYSLMTFKKVLQYLHETDFETTTPNEVHDHFFGSGRKL